MKYLILLLLVGCPESKYWKGQMVEFKNPYVFHCFGEVAEVNLLTVKIVNSDCSSPYEPVYFPVLEVSKAEIF